MTVMAILSPEASEIVAAGRSALRPMSADRDRIEAVLRERLGAAALPPQIQPQIQATPNAARGFGWRFLAPTAGVCVLGGLIFLASRSTPAPNAIAQRKSSDAGAQVALAASANSTASVSPSEETPVEPSSAESESSATVLVPSSNTVLPRRDRLELEVALLSRATSALGAGRFGDALNAVNQHQREFPNGLLTEERRAAKAQALCSLGRVVEGRAQLSHLATRSPVASRAKQVCDSASSPSTASAR